MRCNDRFRHAHEPGTKAVRSDALSADARALKEKVQSWAELTTAVNRILEKSHGQD